MRPSLFLALLLLLFGCGNDNKTAEAISKIDVDLKISRFDRAFAVATPSDIPELKREYPYFFPAQYADSVWEAKLKDTIQISLLEEVDMVFGDFKAEEQNLQSLFRHIKYYFPKYEIPEVVTVTSNVDYANRVILTDSLLLLGLDNYLGSSHRFYDSFARYITADLDKQYLASDVASAFVNKSLRFPTDRIFLSHMIYYGKELYLKDQLMPELQDAQKIAYTQEQLDWAFANEEQIWRYFIEKELLYSTDHKLGPRFLDPAPFSKFQLELDSESPGRIGRFMGWQIVKAFMNNNEISLAELLSLSAEEIFKQSNYKPKR